MKAELKEAFRVYDKEAQVKTTIFVRLVATPCYASIYIIPLNFRRACIGYIHKDLLSHPVYASIYNIALHFRRACIGYIQNDLLSHPVYASIYHIVLNFSLHRIY